MDRRDFLRRLGVTGAAIAATGTLGSLLYEDEKKYVQTVPPKAVEAPRFKPAWSRETPPDLVIASGPPSRAVKAGIEALGGMSVFVPKGAVVVIKPNAAWDRTPAQAANTDPEVVAALVRLCRDAGAKKVIVTDNTCHDSRKSFATSGIGKAAADAGAEVLLPGPEHYKDLDLGGETLGVFPVLKPIIEADVFINVAIAKSHGLSIFTGALKNLYGAIGGRRNRLHQNIHQGIAELGAAFRPPLNIVDATRVLLRSGPTGGGPDDVGHPGRVLFSRDPVALDTYACRYINLKPEEVPHLAIAAKLNVGTHRIENVRIAEVAG